MHQDMQGQQQQQEEEQQMAHALAGAICAHHAGEPVAKGLPHGCALIVVLKPYRCSPRL